MTKRLKFAVPGLAFAAVFPINTFAALAAGTDSYKGADTLLQQTYKADAQPQAGVSPAAQWVADWSAFRKNSATLPPEGAARQWLDLAARYVNLPRGSLNALTSSERILLNRGGGANEPVIASLPGPPAWPFIAKMVGTPPAPARHATAAASASAATPPAFLDALVRAMINRPVLRQANGSDSKKMFEAALRLVASTLVADPAGQRSAVQAFEKIKDANGSSWQEWVDIDSLEDALVSQSGDPAGVAAAFTRKMELARKEQQQANPGFSSTQGSFSVPDLVTLLGGEQTAEPLLKEAILLPSQKLDISGAETKALAARLALDLIPQMKVPRWELACSLDGADLYEALEKRFPADSASSREGDFGTARNYYFLHLIVTGQTARAVEMASSLQGGSDSLPIDELNRAGYEQEVHDFLRELLTKHPELPFWSNYIDLAAKTGKTDEMLALIRSMLNRADLPQSGEGSAHRSFYLALLAADQIDEGVGELRKIIKADEENSASSSNGSGALEESLALARLGQLLERQDLVQEGIAGAKKHLLSDQVEKIQQGTLGSFAELLAQLGRGPEAEDALGQVLGRINGVQAQMNSYSYSAGSRGCLETLVRLYYLAGRPDDVIAVLEKFPGWGAADLKDVLTSETEGYSLAEYSAHAAGDDYPVGYMAAWAFAQRGEKEKALKIVNALLDQNGGFDPGFELLTKLAGQDAIPRLDELMRRDRFEERPLIWKAKLQLDAGKMDDAEKTIRDAIAIDPSDGEQGPGRRMRAYAVLADVLEKKGDQEHAQIYRGAVAAIRISEHADRFYEAGLLSRAVKMYREALTHFSNAYCIQSRLALRLSEMGDIAGAEEHYRRAYELMPESFGRVESHCFGCERAFAGERAQGIAEKVFTELAAKMPEKPQVHYLLGYLRFEEDRYREALPEFQQAVKLDPEYLNAWKKIGELSEDMYIPTELRNEVALNQARLDPLMRHGSLDTEDVTDLAGIWNAVEAAKNLQPPPLGPLLPLTAAAAEMHKVVAAGGSNVEDEVSEASSGEELTAGSGPIGVIARNRFLDAASRVFQMAGQQGF